MIRSTALGLVLFFAGVVAALSALAPLQQVAQIAAITTLILGGIYLATMGCYLLAIPLYELHERVNEQLEAMKRRPKPRPTYTDKTRQPISTEGA